MGKRRGGGKLRRRHQGGDGQQWVVANKVRHSMHGVEFWRGCWPTEVRSGGGEGPRRSVIN